jgi:hypothetical protein
MMATERFVFVFVNELSSLFRCPLCVCGHTESAVPSLLLGKGITSAVWLNGMDVDEAIEVLTVRYRRALQRLKAAIGDELPDLAWATEPRLADEQNSMQCSYRVPTSCTVLTRSVH